jgi:hypothetical protein
MGDKYDEFVRQPEPDADDLGFEWRIKRSPPTSKPVAYLGISSQLEGIRTHFVGGRTVPHLLRDCVGCKHGSKVEWHGYLLAVEDRSRDRVIFEITARGAGPLLRWQKEHGTIRGLIFRASRAENRSNAPVRIECRRFCDPTQGIPPEEPIIPILARLWHVNVQRTAMSSQTGDAGMTEAERMEIAKKNSRTVRERDTENDMAELAELADFGRLPEERGAA